MNLKKERYLFFRLSNVSISFRNSRCSTQTAFIGTLGFKFTYRKTIVMMVAQIYLCYRKLSLVRIKYRTNPKIL